MHISTNISHWVCIGTGLLLVVVGIISDARRQVTTVAAIAATGQSDSQGSGLGKRLILIGIGLFAVAYGMSRVLN